jgi:hypothetical protein
VAKLKYLIGTVTNKNYINEEITSDEIPRMFATAQFIFSSHLLS